MKIKSLLMLIILGFTGCIGVVERPAVVYVEPRPTVVVEPASEVVIIHGVPTRQIIVSPRPRPIVIHRHHH